MDYEAQTSPSGAFSGNGSSFAARIAMARQADDDSPQRDPAGELQWETLLADFDRWAGRIDGLTAPSRSEVDELSDRLVTTARRLERLA
jgi:hypothetical protein